MALDFDRTSSNQRLNGIQNSIYQPTGFPVAFFCMGYPTSLGGARTIHSVRDAGGTGDPRTQVTLTGDESFQYFLDGGSDFAFAGQSSGTVTATNTWYAIMCWSNSTADHNVEANNANSANGTGSVLWAPGMDQTHVGYLANFGNLNHWDGAIAEVAMWSGTIPTASQREALQNGVSAAFFMEGLIGYNRIMGNQDPEPDRVSGDLLTLVNGPTKFDHPDILMPGAYKWLVPPLPAAVSGPSGNGALASTDSQIAGDGVSGSAGNGTLSSTVAVVAGNGVSQSAGNGALQAQAAAVTGSGLQANFGNGALSAQAAAVVGEGLSKSDGSGTLAASTAAIVAGGISFSAGNGTLSSTDSQISGGGGGGLFGNGTLSSTAATVTGDGKIVLIGSGTLSAQAAAVAADGASASAGNGTLSAGSARISGSGDTGVTTPAGRRKFVYREFNRATAMKKRVA